jgi:CheY-like chemotaxis protein
MKGRVLLADDEPVLVECLSAILKAENFEVQAVNCASAAIAALDTGEFDLVITDMAMETRTAGYDVVRAAQRQSYRPEVVILTAFYIPTAEWKERGVRQLFTKGEGMPRKFVSAVVQIYEELIRSRATLSAQNSRRA